MKLHSCLMGVVVLALHTQTALAQSTPSAESPPVAIVPPAPTNALPEQTNAVPVSFATRYATGSASIYGGLWFQAIGTTSQQSQSISGAVSGRFVTAGSWAFQPTIFGSWSRGESASGAYSPTSTAGVGVGLGVGKAFVISERIALTPMVVVSASYRTYTPSVFGSTTTPSVSASIEVQVGAELPLTVYLTRNVFIEPALTVFGAIATDSSSAFRMTVGQRIGFTF